jgi:hypothetical protein
MVLSTANVCAFWLEGARFRPQRHKTGKPIRSPTYEGQKARSLSSSAVTARMLKQLSVALLRRPRLYVRSASAQLR